MPAQGREPVAGPACHEVVLQVVIDAVGGEDQALPPGCLQREGVLVRAGVVSNPNLIVLPGEAFVKTIARFATRGAGLVGH